MEIGSAADWVAAAFTGGGLFAAVYQLRLGRLDNRAAREREAELEHERQWAMARSVGISVEWEPGPDGGTPSGVDAGHIPATVRVLNSSPYPISGAVIQLYADDYPREVVLGTLLPGDDFEQTEWVRRREVVFGELTSGATLLFTDTHGNHWARTPTDCERRDQPARIC
ncbi:hypothetical protein KLP28_17185 [Nocardioidaceae bacterium]|nr:hypothetical protein KLP28_17185 [Nocardioidaceae bacterium]